MRGLFLLLLAATTPALAADIFSPVPGDLSLTMLLQPVFGSLFGGEGDGPLGEALAIFNACCLTVGGLLAAYTIVAGTMQTAHDGEMLGKRWSSMWVPIRLAVGTAAIVPIGSFCAAQMLVAWLAIQGIGLADNVWSAFTRSSFASQSLASATAPTPNASRLAFGMLRSQVCIKGFERLTQDGMGTVFSGRPTTTGDMNHLRRYGVPGMSATQCGGVVGSQASGGTLASTAGFFGINTGAAERANAIRQAHAAATLALEAELAPIAERIVSGHGAQAEADYIAAVSRYQQAIGQAAKAQMGDKAYFDRMAQNASTEGWVLSGAWFMRFVALEDALMKALADTPTAMPVEAAPDGMAADMDRHYGLLAGAVRDASATGLDNQLVADRAREDSESGIIMSAINAVFNKITDGSRAGFNFLSDADSQRHPLLVASSAGHTMMTWALALAVASVVAAKVGGMTVAMVLGGFVMALLAGGATLAYLLPLLPFIIWMGAVAGWLLMVMEAIIGAPLWAVAHLNPRGEEFHGGASAGYMLVLELTLKPALMVLGFAFAVLVSLPLGQLINKLFFSTFELSQGGFIGFVGMLAAVAIYSALMLTMLKASFGAIHKVPDQVMKWLGGGHGSGLAEAGGTGTAVEHQSSAATSAVTGAVAGAATSKLNTMAHRPNKPTRGKPDGKAEAAEANVAPGDPVKPLAEQAVPQKEQHEREIGRAVDDAFGAKRDGGGSGDSEM
jgi:conjugal transfer/type IV secretion protein DotA/TraY